MTFRRLYIKAYGASVHLQIEPDRFYFHLPHDRTTAQLNPTTQLEMLKPLIPDEIWRPQATPGSSVQIAQGSHYRLCEECQGINIESLTAKEGYRHRSHNSLLTKQCLLCRSISLGLQLWHLDLSTRSPPSIRNALLNTPIILRAGYRYNMGFIEVFLVTTIADTSPPTHISIFTENEDPATTYFNVPVPRTVKSSGSEDCLDLASTWLQYCIKNHNCSASLSADHGTSKTPTSESYWPTRLLDLEAFPSQCKDLRLIEGSEQRAAYASLSHCWGSHYKSQNRTLSTNIEAHKAVIRFAELPSTFRDAVTICRRVGIRYLWIDSLCIIQDSSLDWKKEAAAMAHVYGNSTVTIAANWGTHSDSGCFNGSISRSASERDTVMAGISETVLQSGRASKLIFLFGSFFDVDFNITSSPLSCRAWTLQERVLPPRILHFAEDGLFWECRDSFASQDLLPSAYIETHSEMIFKVQQMDLAGKLHIWYSKVLTEYTERQITMHTDRLIAISALARMFAADIGCPYLAGLWLEGLYYGLTWSRVESYAAAIDMKPTRRTSDKSRPRTYIAPTWSWASINAPVAWHFPREGQGSRQLLDIVEAKVDHDGDAFGQIIHGTLRVIGQLLKNVPLVANKKTGHPQFDNSVLHATASTSTNETTSVWLDTPEELPDTIHCLPVWHQPYSNGEGYTRHCLLLSTSSNAGDRVFHRCGYTSLSDDISIAQWPKHEITIV